MNDYELIQSGHSYEIREAESYHNMRICSGTKSYCKKILNVIRKSGFVPGTQLKNGTVGKTYVMDLGSMGYMLHVYGYKLGSHVLGKELLESVLVENKK